MKILVIGGTRFIGRQLVSELAQQGHDVTLLSRGNTRPEFPAGVKTIWGRREDSNVLQQIFAGNNFEVVFDNIAYGGTAVTSFWNAAQGKVARYVLTSTAWIYATAAPKEQQALKESTWSPETNISEAEARRIYGELDLPPVTQQYLIEKLAAERAAFALNCPVTILRPAMVAGFLDHNRRIEYFLGNRQPVQGQAPMQLLWVNDLARAMAALLSIKSADKQIFNLAPAEKISKSDIARWISEVLPREAGRPAQAGNTQADPFLVPIPGFFDSTAFLAACPSFRYTQAEEWIKATAQRSLREAALS